MLNRETRFTVRNITVNNASTAIYSTFTWGAPSYGIIKLTWLITLGLFRLDVPRREDK